MRNVSLGWVTAGTIAVLPFLPRFGLLYGAVTSKFFFLILAVDVLVLLYVWQVYKKKREVSIGIRRPFLITLGIVLLSFFASSVAGIYFEHSFWADILRSTGFVLLLHMAIWAFVTGEVHTLRDWTLIRRAIVFSAALFSIFTILGVGGLGLDIHILWLDLESLGVTFGNDTFAGMYLVLAFMVGCIELNYTRTKKLKLWIIAALGFIAVSPIFLNVRIFLEGNKITDLIGSPELLLGSARASTVALVLFVTFLLAWVGIRKFTNAKWGNLICAGLATLYLVSFLAGSLLLITPGSTVQNLYADETTEARFVVWESIGSAIQERPLLGWGPENFDQAFERHFDDRLYTKEGTVEVWFTKAHNVTLDTLISVGTVGASALIIMLIGYSLVVWRAGRTKVITEMEAVVLLALPIVHLIQLQTAFNVVTSYALLAVIGGYVLWLERKQTNTREQSVHSKVLVYVIGAIAVASMITVLLYEYPRQLALVKSLSERDSERRMALIEQGMSRVSDYEGLHRSANILVQSAEVELRSSEDVYATKQQALSYAEIYEKAYVTYLHRQPEHYRARMNYAYLLLVETEWGRDRTQEALDIIESSYNLSPGNPLTYVLHAIAFVYAGEMEAARERIEVAVEHNPDIELTKDAKKWLEKQERQYPKRTFLFIGNI